MINAKELRLGNWVQCDGYMGDYIAQVFAIDVANNIGVLFNREIQWLGDKTENIKPLPLTKEVLENFGFESEHRYLPTVGRYNVYKLDGFNVIDYETHFGVSLSPAKLETVHQLQNMHFAIMQKELNLK